MKIAIRICIAALLIGGAMGVRALEIDPMVKPEINIGGRALVTTAYSEQTDAAGVKHSDTELDIADSSLLFGFSKYLFNNHDYGFGALGIKTVEDGSDLDEEIYLHQLYAGIGGPRYELTLGRTQLPNTLLKFPTLRDDDLLEFTHVGNGLADRHAEELQIYGGQVRGQWWFTPATQLGLAFTARAEEDPSSGELSHGQFNGQTLWLAYELLESIKFDRGLRYAALAVDRQSLNALGGEADDEDMTAVIGALAVNLSNNPQATWNLDLQAIVNNGAAVSALDEAYRRARAKSNALVAALRFGHRPHLQTRWQAALTLGWKDFSDFSGARSLVVAPSYVYHIGAGVELLAQYRYLDNSDELTQATGFEKEHAVYLGISFAFDYTLNESVGTRNSILNREHNMTDFGPVFGGH